MDRHLLRLINRYIRMLAEESAEQTIVCKIKPQEIEPGYEDLNSSTSVMVSVVSVSDAGYSVNECVVNFKSHLRSWFIHFREELSSNAFPRLFSAYA